MGGLSFSDDVNMSILPPQGRKSQAVTSHQKSGWAVAASLSSIWALSDFHYRKAQFAVLNLWFKVKIIHVEVKMCGENTRRCQNSEPKRIVCCAPLSSFSLGWCCGLINFSFTGTQTRKEKWGYFKTEHNQSAWKSFPLSKEDQVSVSAQPCVTYSSVLAGFHPGFFFFPKLDFITWLLGKCIFSVQHISQPSGCSSKVRWSAQKSTVLLQFRVREMLRVKQPLTFCFLQRKGHIWCTCSPSSARGRLCK